MSAIKETVIAGKIILVKMINRKSVRRGEKRANRKQITSEEVERINRRNSEKTLIIKMHHNFKAGDYHIVLTYGGNAPSIEEAEKRFKKFKDKVRRWAKKNNKEFKWIAVTEWEHKRVHHHIVINSEIPIEIINEFWEHGFVRNTLLDKSGDYRKLCSYLMKETDKTFRNPDCPTRLRYSASRNLQMPTVYREEIRMSEILDDPKPIKGYYVDKDSVWRGINPITGSPCTEYILLPLDEGKAKKRFNKKAKVKYKQENYDRFLRKIAERQIAIDFPSIV